MHFCGVSQALVKQLFGIIIVLIPLFFFAEGLCRSNILFTCCCLFCFLMVASVDIRLGAMRFDFFAICTDVALVL